MRDDTALIDFKHGYGHMLAGIGEDAAHSQFLCN
jgi:hypothetical protein